MNKNFPGAVKDFVLARSYGCKNLRWAWQDARYWLRSRFHPKYRYHIVKTGLRPGYYDEDTLILHSCMALLERFVAWHDGEHALEAFSKELLEKPDVWGCGHDEMLPQVKKQTEALAIYRWWKREYPAKKAHIESLWGTSVPGEEIFALEEKIVDEEQLMLHRLIEIRPSLWE